MPFVNAEKKKCPSIPRAIIATKLSFVLFTCFPTRQNTNSGQKRCCCSCKIPASCFSIVLERSRMYNNPSKEKKMPQWRNSQSSSSVLAPSTGKPLVRSNALTSTPLPSSTHQQPNKNSSAPFPCGAAQGPGRRSPTTAPGLDSPIGSAVGGGVPCGGGEWRGRSHPYERLLKSHIHHDDLILIIACQTGSADVPS
jgi:hypothetical protein